MNLVLVGINHRTAPVEVRERMYIQESHLPAAVSNLVGCQGILEGMILSTCNRVEVVANADEGVEPEPILRQFLSDLHHFELSAWERYFYWRRQEEAIRHLCRVAASLDSMILGEPQILGQVKQAYAISREAGALTGTLHEIVNQALNVARKVRRETALGSNAVSVSYAAVELAKKIFGSLEGKSILVLGAGKMSEQAARHLLQAGAKSIFVANRTYGRALELAETFQGTAIRYEQLAETMNQADIVISSTRAPGYVVTRAQAAQLMAARRKRPIFFVDIAVPRDIEPSINQIENAFVYDIDDLEQVVAENRGQREKEAVWAEQMIEEEVQRTMRRLASREVAPTIMALEARLGQIRESEMEHFRGRLNSLTEEQRRAVEEMTRRMLNKILHGPITELKNGAGHPGHSALVQVIRKVFGVE